MIRWFFFTAGAVLLLAACSAKQPASTRPPLFCPAGDDLAAYVDPLAGTDAGGNAMPGAMVPYGMVKVSPDTDTPEAASYQYGDSIITGFSHFHLEGPGGDYYGYSNLRLLPGTGPLSKAADAAGSSFSHSTEQASPGYYAVTLDDYSTRVELTATAQAAVHRYTFPSTPDAWVVIDAGKAHGTSLGGSINVVGDHSVQGFGTYGVAPVLDVTSTPGTPIGHVKIYFDAEFSRPFSRTQTWAGGGALTDAKAQKGPNVGAVLHFDATADPMVEVRIGISLVSVAQAQKNLAAQVGDAAFDDVRAEARRLWNCYLNRVVVEGGTDAERRTFYTSLYHNFMQPSDYSETGGIFAINSAGIGPTARWTDKHFFTDDWCSWDTFRTSDPLRTLIDPVTAGDIGASFLKIYDEGGWLPKCAWNATNYSRAMIGDHAIAVLADDINKHMHGINIAKAWKATEHSAFHSTGDNLLPTLCGYVALGTVPDYRNMGYVPHQCDQSQSASMTLEYAYDDWCAAQIARAAGDTKTAATLQARSQNYKNQWDASTGFMRGKNRDGSWVTPFDPTVWGFALGDPGFDNDFTEASAWVYTFFVPQDIPGLMKLMGGAAGLENKLDAMVAGGYLEMQNEPSFDIPYLYNFAGRPDKTEALVRSILATDFSPTPAGLPGNDDAGATSAWYLFGAMGFYPVTPGNGRYQLTSPLFTKITVRLDPAIYAAHQFVIEAPGASDTNQYIQSVTLNGASLQRTYVTHAELVKGATLHFDLGPTPGSWQQRP